jgi:hypothetical protein
MLSGMHPFSGYPTVLVLYRFRYFDPVSKRWVKARYVAQRHEIAARYEQWGILGEPELAAPKIPDDTVRSEACSTPTRRQRRH